MSCTCKKHADLGATDYSKLPDAPCVYCAEKHFSQAMQLAKQPGYAAPNRQAIIGELGCAQWHLYKEHPQLALLIRDIRHEIQTRKPVADSEWTNVCIQVDALIDKI